MRRWRPSALLEPQPEYDFSPDDDLRRQWLEHRSNDGDIDLTGLRRKWAIETGIIEGLYWLAETQTRTLVENGFEPSAIPPCGTGQDPDNLLAILRDHMMALDAIYSEVRRGRSISLTAIRQLHQIMVAHQPTYRTYSRRDKPSTHASYRAPSRRCPTTPPVPTASSTSTAHRNMSTRNWTTC